LNDQRGVLTVPTIPEGGAKESLRMDLNVASKTYTHKIVVMIIFPRPPHTHTHTHTYTQKQAHARTHTHTHTHTECVVLRRSRGLAAACPPSRCAPPTLPTPTARRMSSFLSCEVSATPCQPNGLSTESETRKIDNRLEFERKKTTTQNLQKNANFTTKTLN